MTEMLISDTGDAVMDIDEEDVMLDVEDSRPASFPRLRAGLMEVSSGLLQAEKRLLHAGSVQDILVEAVLLCGLG